MKKCIKFTIFCTLVIVLFSLIECTPKGKTTIKAIYLAPENGGQLTKEQTEKCPEVIRVTSFNELKNLASKNTSIWIDKDTVDLIDSNWFSKGLQNQVPIVLIGYNNALYSFRDKLPGFGIQGPYFDWSKLKLEPGFSIWMLRERTEQSTTAFMKGYDIIPDTQLILSITNTLFEGKIPE